MQDVDSEDWLSNLDLIFDDEDFADKPLSPAADEVTDSYGQKPQAPITEATGLGVPLSGLLGGEELPDNQYERCLEPLLEIFPGISLEYVRELYNTSMQASQSSPRIHQVIDAFQNVTLQILDAKSYPKEEDRQNDLKRKRSQALDSEEEDVLQRKSGRKEPKSAGYFQAASSELQTEFVFLHANIINRKIHEEGSCYSAYLALAKDELAYEDTGKSPYPRLKHPRKVRSNLTSDAKADFIGYNKPEIQRELQLAREKLDKIRAKRKAEVDAMEAEAATEKLQRDNGEVFECQCCYEELTMNKITHCDGDTIHYFCLECAKRNADNEIGNMRFKLICMSGDVCAASFSRNERHRFLDEKALLVLDRMELQAAIKEAGVQIVWCPFCDFGASCPPVYIDREFRCQGPDCGKVSCRICKIESHVPWTCDEWKEKNQMSERHILEEARTAALLKRCPKCNVPVFKELGCNRLPCPCGGTMCDFCGKDITGIGYAHFKRDDGSKGDDKKCPTFDDFDTRRRNAVKTAEADALKEAQARNPNLNQDALKMKFHDDPPSVSEKAAKNDRRRDVKAEIPRPRATLERERQALARTRPPPPVPQERQPVRLDRQAGTFAGYQSTLHRPVQPPAAPAVPLPQHYQGHQAHQSVVAPTQSYQPYQTHQSVVPPTQPYQHHQTLQFVVPPAAVPPVQVAANPVCPYPPHLPAYGPMAFQPAQYVFDPPQLHPSQLTAFAPVGLPEFYPQPAPGSNIQRNY